MTNYIDREKLKDKLNNTSIFWSIKCKPKVKEEKQAFDEIVNKINKINKCLSVFGKQK